MNDDSREIALLRRQIYDVMHTERYAAQCAIDSFRKRAERAEAELAALRKQHQACRKAGL